MARARISTSQCAAPVTAVNADGAVISSAPAARSSLYSSGKAQVVTDRQADPADRRVRHDHVTAISIVIGFTVTAAIVRHIHIEQVQLVVARHGFALIIDQQRAGMGLGRRLIHRRQRATYRPLSIT